MPPEISVSTGMVYYTCTETLVHRTEHGVEYIHNIILPYVKLIRELKQDDSASALVIIDNFKGQVTDAIHILLEENNISVALLPANTTDLLQPLDIAVNKPAKNYVRQQFQD